MPDRQAAALEGLRQELEKGRVVVLVGAGASIATVKEREASWVGLLDHARRFVRDRT